MSEQKEAKVRIKINKFLEEAGWSFFDSEDGKTNPTFVTITRIAGALSSC